MRNKDEIASITDGTGREWQRNNVGTRFHSWSPGRLR